MNALLIARLIAEGKEDFALQLLAEMECCQGDAVQCDAREERLGQIRADHRSAGVNRI